jgi:hypothetical protein
MFHQRAHGTFTAPVVPGTPHCGIDDTSLCNCAYRIELVYDDNALDSDGFLLDNTAFRQYFNDLCQTPVSISCENLCRKIAADLCVLCSDRAKRVRVALAPFAGVEVAYTHRPTRESTTAILREFSEVS